MGLRKWMKRKMVFMSVKFLTRLAYHFPNFWHRVMELIRKVESSVDHRSRVEKKSGTSYVWISEGTNDSLRSEKIPGKWQILFISHDACLGGAQLVLLNLLQWFKEHTFIDLKIICLNGGSWEERFRTIAETLIWCDLEKTCSSDDEIILKIQEFCGGIPKLIYGNTVSAGRAYRILKNLNIPIVTHFHELQMSINKYASDCIEDVLRYTTHFVACSDAVCNNLIQQHNVEQSCISVVYASISPNKTTEVQSDDDKTKLKKQLGLQTNKVLVFGCGVGMVYRKGADLFIQVARTLKEKGYKDFHFYWIGCFDGNETDDRNKRWSEHLKTLTEDGLDEYVTFLGLQDNPREYLQVGDVFLLPSREDPFPLVCLEAAECRLPIVCFADAGGMPDFVEEDAGFVVPYNNIKEMAQKVAFLLENEIERMQLGEQARRKLFFSYITDVTAPNIFSVCRKEAKQKAAVSVIVPNYNHSRFLKKRLESIFQQTFQDMEIILLDDASTDKSLEILESYAHRQNVQLIKNIKNSGSTFFQWLKGIENTHSDILWIAESDDYCDPDFLKILLPRFGNPEIKLAYADSFVINEEGIVYGDYVNCEYLTSLSENKWKKSYQATASEEINDGLGIKNTILNASAVLFRRFPFPEEFCSTLTKLRMAGDWFVFVNAIKGGDVYFEAQKLNYHRRYDASVIGQTADDTKKIELFKEIALIHKFIITQYPLSNGFPEKWENYLRQQWSDFFPETPFLDIQQHYPFNEIKDSILQSNQVPVY